MDLTTILEIAIPLGILGIAILAGIFVYFTRKKRNVLTVGNITPVGDSDITTTITNAGDQIRQSKRRRRKTQIFSSEF